MLITIAHCLDKGIVMPFHFVNEIFKFGGFRKLFLNAWLILLSLGFAWPQTVLAQATNEIGLSSLPAEVRQVLNSIRQNGPFAYDKDGSVFGNYERRLPIKPRGYYQEYTVPTPGLRHRGARRIVTGGQPPQVFYYTDDHYGSFRQIRD